MSRRPYVLLLSGTLGYRVEKIAQGVLAGCRQHGLSLLWKNFHHFHTERLEARPIGILINGAPPRVLRQIRQLGSDIPLVSVLGDTLHLPIPTVVPDPRQLAGAVADHFAAEGMKQVLFAAPREQATAAWIAKELIRSLENRPVPLRFHDFHVHQSDTYWASDREDAQRLVRAFQQFGFPLGVFAFSDQIAANCLACAEDAGLQVPQQVAVVGMGDYPLFSAARLSISSFRIDFEAMGKAAVEMILQRRDQAPSAELKRERRLIGGELIVRDSSQVRLAQDPQLARAIQYLHTHYDQPLSLASLARAAGMSRSSLSCRFRGATGQSVMQYLLGLRLQKAKLLLASSSLTVAEVADRVGIGRQSYFTRIFRRFFQTTPTAFRAGFAPPADRRLSLTRKTTGAPI